MTDDTSARSACRAAVEEADIISDRKNAYVAVLKNGQSVAPEAGGPPIRWAWISAAALIIGGMAAVLWAVARDPVSSDAIRTNELSVTGTAGSQIVNSPSAAPAPSYPAVSESFPVPTASAIEPRVSAGPTAVATCGQSSSASVQATLLTRAGLEGGVPCLAPVFSVRSDGPTPPCWLACLAEYSIGEWSITRTAEVIDPSTGREWTRVEVRVSYEDSNGAMSEELELYRVSETEDQEFQVIEWAAQESVFPLDDADSIVREYLAALKDGNFALAASFLDVGGGPELTEREDLAPLQLSPRAGDSELVAGLESWCLIQDCRDSDVVGTTSVSSLRAQVTVTFAGQVSIWHVQTFEGKLYVLGIPPATTNG